MATHIVRETMTTCDDCGEKVKKGDLIRVSRVNVLSNGIEVDQDLLELCLPCGGKLMTNATGKQVSFTPAEQSDDSEG